MPNSPITIRSLWRRLAPQWLRIAAGHILRPLAIAYTLHAAKATKNKPGAGLPTLVGFFSGANGIALSAQLASQALDRLGIDHRCVSVEHLKSATIPECKSASAWIFFLNPPEMLWLMFLWGPSRLSGPRYGYWAWELEKAPYSWRRAAAALSGILAPSTFTAHALRGDNVPVTTTPHPVSAENYAAMAKGPDRLPGDPFRVVSLFDFKSSVARKNPLGAIQAFERAFGHDPTARLIFKTHNADFAPDLVRQLCDRAGPNVEFIDAVWTRQQAMAFIAAADVLISLHRSEGFGLSLAEAMALGTPVVATGWSGNLDFMDDETACLVPVTLIPVDDPQRIYRGQRWAEPDIDAAASYLKRLRDHPALASAMASRARAKVERELSPEAWLASLPPPLQVELRQT